MNELVASKLKSSTVVGLAGAGYSRGLTAEICCREHPDTPLVEDFHAGDMICSLCGLVVGDRVIDVSAEWITFSNKESDSTKDRSRVGKTENPLLDGSEISSMIATGGDIFRDQFGKSQYKNRYLISNSDKTLTHAFRDIAQMADKLKMPKILVDQASVLFKQVRAKKAMRGHKFDALVPACLYIACRQDSVPRTFKEICAVSNVSKKEIGRMFKIIVKILETKVNLVTTEDFMSRFCCILGLTQEVQRTARHIAKTAMEMEFMSGRSPVTIAAAAIYMASEVAGNKKTAKEISEVAGVSTKCILKSFNLMFPKIDCLLPADVTYNLPADDL